MTTRHTMRMEMSVRIWLTSIKCFKLAKAGIVVCSIEITWAKNCSGDIAGPQRTDVA